MKVACPEAESGSIKRKQDLRIAISRCRRYPGTIRGRLDGPRCPRTLVARNPQYEVGRRSEPRPMQEFEALQNRLDEINGRI